MKHPLCLLVAALLAATAAAAEDFDGSQTMICQPFQGHDCLPTEISCKPLKAEKGRDIDFAIDVANRTVKSPYRTALLPIQNVTNNTKSLLLQGTTLEIVWSAAIQRATGRLTIAIADREGAYVVFAQCKLADAHQPSVPAGRTAN